MHKLFYFLYTDHTENSESNNSSIIVYLLLREHVYRATAQ
jgi:hypothetical protein